MREEVIQKEKVRPFIPLSQSKPINCADRRKLVRLQTQAARRKARREKNNGA